MTLPIIHSTIYMFIFLKKSRKQVRKRRDKKENSAQHLHISRKIIVTRELKGKHVHWGFRQAVCLKEVEKVAYVRDGKIPALEICKRSEMS